jgi:hypothetical protein
MSPTNSATKKPSLEQQENACKEILCVFSATVAEDGANDNDRGT